MAENDLVWVEGCHFAEAIDGYFPLRISLEHMLARNQFSAAIVTLSYAPIMYIPNLPPEEPVPLNIRSGHAGIIDQVSVCVLPNQLSGFGHWRWFSSDIKSQSELNPLTRLAEPAFVEGIGFKGGDEPTEFLGKLKRADHGEVSLSYVPQAALDNHKRTWGPFNALNCIDFSSQKTAAHGTRISDRDFSNGLYIQSGSELFSTD